MNELLYKACFAFDSKRVNILVKVHGADDFECLVEFRYYELAVFVFTKNIRKNMKLLKEFHKSDIIELLNHGLPVYLHEYICIYNKYKYRVEKIMDICKDKISLYDENIVKQILAHLPYPDQKNL